MKTTFFSIFFLLLFSKESHSQQLTYKGNGNVKNEQNLKLNPDQVRKIIENKKDQLDLYNIGRTKKTVGNVLLYGGITTIIAKFGIDVFSPIEYKPINGYSVNSVQAERTTITGYIIGGAFIIAAIPIKLGFSKKIKKAIDGYNESLQIKTSYNFENATIIANQNGIGMKITF
jgi:hypothetical protein